MASPFNILKQSPHDFGDCQHGLVEAPRSTQWVPSRYNVRATTKDGRLVLWNTYTGRMNVFTTEQRPAIERLLSQQGFEAQSTGMVKYLQKRGFLVKEGTDEYRRIRLGFGSQQYRTDRLELILLASEDCNFRCQYCYEDFARGTMQPKVRDGIKHLLEKRRSGLRTLTVAWFGGEPLYGWAAIEDLAPHFLHYAEENSLGYFSNMTTNGYLLTPDVAEKLLAWKITKFQITIDGTPEDHDRNRPTRDGQGTFGQIFENLKSLRQRPDEFSVDLRVNFDRNNYPHLGCFLDLVEHEFKGDERFKLRFRAIGRWGGPNDADLAVCGADESKKLQIELRAEARRRGLNISDDLREVKGLGSQVCYAARPYNLIIGATGKIMKCTIELDKSDRNVVGYLDEDGTLEIDQDKLALWTEPAFESDKKCQKCVVLPSCQGISCPLIRFEQHRSPCIPLRMNAKKELRMSVEAGTHEGRRVVI